MDYETKFILKCACIGVVILSIVYFTILSLIPRKSTEDIVKIARCRDFYECEDISK